MPQSLLKQAVRNSIFNGLISAATFAIALLFMGYRIRLLGMERAGYMMTIEGIISLTGTLGGFGFGTAALRKIAALYSQEKFVEIRSCLGAVLLVSLATGFLVALAIPFSFPWIFRWSKINIGFWSDAFHATAILALIFLFRQLFNTYEVVYHALQRYDIIAIINSTFGFLRGSLGLVILKLFPTMTAVASLFFALAVTHALVNLVVVRRLVRGIVFPVVNVSELRSMVHFGGWAYLGDISRLMARGLDRIILTTVLGSAFLPYYVIGQRVFQQVHTALAGQGRFLFPMLAAEGERSSAVVTRVEDRLRWFFAFISTTAYGALALLAYPILTFVVGPDFARYALLPFILACLQGLFHAQAVVPYYVTWAEGNAKPNAVFEFLNGILVFATMILLVPKMNVLGASVAQLWVGGTTLMLIIWVARLGGRFSWKAVFRPWVSTGAAWILCSLLGWVGWVTRNYGFTPYLVIVGMGWMLALAVSLLIESRWFKEFRCLETLRAAIRILLQRFVRITAGSKS